MRKQVAAIGVTKFKQDPSATLRRLRRSNEPLVVTERGKAAAVLLSPEAYDRGQREAELLRLLARGERQIAAGKGYELEHVLADAEKLLKKL